MLDKVLSDSVVISPESVSYRVEQENLYKQPNIQFIKIFTYSLNEPAPKDPLKYFFISRLLIKMRGRFQAF